MAYAAIAPVEHGDYPTAALWNQIIANLQAISDLADVSNHNVAAPVFAGADEDEADWQFVRVNRYLRYGDEATITGPDEGQTASLPKPESGAQGVYDLDTISWLAPGMTYVVSGCAWAIEDWEP